jgi:hypothetical protein
MFVILRKNQFIENYAKILLNESWNICLLKVSRLLILHV